MIKLKVWTVFMAFLVTSIGYSNFLKAVSFEDVNSLRWVGTKVSGKHEGTIGIKSVDFKFDSKTKNLIGGQVLVDMQSINTTDIKGEWKKKLDDHLKNADFFDVVKYPTSKMVFKSVKLKSSDENKKVYEVVADLTMLNVTKPVSFELKEDPQSFKTQFKVNRTHYGIKYKSKNFFKKLGDKVINDDFDLIVSLKKK